MLIILPGLRIHGYSKLGKSGLAVQVVVKLSLFYSCGMKGGIAPPFTLQTKVRTGQR